MNNNTGIDPAPMTSCKDLSRRQCLQGVVGLMAGLVINKTGLADEQAISKQPLVSFMSLSQTLTGHASLDMEVGQQLLKAFLRNRPDFALQFPALQQALTVNKFTPEQESLRLQIMQAWYEGTVNGQVVAYERALMFAAAVGKLTPRSYCQGKPGFWAQAPVANKGV